MHFIVNHVGKLCLVDYNFVRVYVIFPWVVCFVIGWGGDSYRESNKVMVGEGGRNENVVLYYASRVDVKTV